MSDVIMNTRQCPDGEATQGRDWFQSQLNQKANVELAKRTVASYTILLIYLIFVAITPYFKEHATAVIVFGALLALSLAVRVGIARHVSAAQSAWLLQYSLASLFMAMVWGGFVWATFCFYQLTWIFFLLVICTIGITAAATSSLSPNSMLARAYALFLTGPIVAIGFWGNTRPSITLSVLMGLFIAALLIMIRDNHHLFWNSLSTIENLNTQKSDLESVISSVVGNSDKLRDASRNLSAISGDMSQSAEDMSDKSSIVSGSLKELKVNSKTTSDAMTQLSENASRLAGLTAAMTESIRNISQNTQDTDAIARQAVSQTRRVTEKVNQLGESARQVGTISEAIEDISSQTNLLALNATIDAARAGEAGKGFAVVANEIKALAGQTAEATEQIKNQIDTIQAAIAETVSEIGRISEITTDIGRSAATSATSVQEQSVMAGTISAGVAEASESIAVVRTHADRTQETTEKIAQNISLVNIAVSEVLGHSMNVEESADSILERANELTDVMAVARPEPVCGMGADQA
jgi:methyl-accepting chemotaxis protein